MSSIEIFRFCNEQLMKQRRRSELKWNNEETLVDKIVWSPGDSRILKHKLK